MWDKVKGMRSAFARFESSVTAEYAFRVLNGFPVEPGVDRQISVQYASSQSRIDLKDRSIVSMRKPNPFEAIQTGSGQRFDPYPQTNATNTVFCVFPKEMHVSEELIRHILGREHSGNILKVTVKGNKAWVKYPTVLDATLALERDGYKDETTMDRPVAMTFARADSK
eukprot:TRINITY_DN9092_c0_g1_i3.p2 TRINITY_DN9092_c0_g1~~TRINITY_DN9092_c0_g1_i3.p2  ORF type:complete len:168 (+),score=28.65 TRINITY_DN9092_c0_g1_i3:260-763(+)